MDIVLSRILMYLNGCLDDDHMYRIGNFIIKNYRHMPEYTMEAMEKEGFTQGEILDFCRHLGFDTYEDFLQKMEFDQGTRLDQITLRMINSDVSLCLSKLDISSTPEEFCALIDRVAELIFENNRVVIVGDLYPSSIAVELQTDLISLGKEVVCYHHFDKNFRFHEDDVVIFMTATGRTMRSNAKKMKAQDLCDAWVVLITQNARYRSYDGVKSDYTIHVKGRYDGIEFNHQLMLIFDMIRIRYYQKYFV